MKKINILYFILISFFFTIKVYASENNSNHKEIANCVDENLNPCNSLNIPKDKSDINIIDNNLSKEKKKKITKKKVIKKSIKKITKKNKINIKSNSKEKKVKKSSNIVKKEKKNKLIKKKEKKKRKKQNSLLTSSKKLNKNLNLNKEMSFNEYKELLLNYSTSSEYPNIDN
tara:strand:+ start:69 stop:581 length:513 start_codon:yes stop_codon:yes gene_type:complete